MAATIYFRRRGANRRQLGIRGDAATVRSDPDDLLKVLG
jgi:hypothetical protein